MGLFKKTDYNRNITEIDGKIPSISGLATSAVLTVVENKIPDVSILVKKKKKRLWCKNSWIADIENKYITIANYNKLTKNMLLKG